MTTVQNIVLALHLYDITTDNVARDKTFKIGASQLFSEQLCHMMLMNKYDALTALNLAANVYSQNLERHAACANDAAIQQELIEC